MLVCYTAASIATLTADCLVSIHLTMCHPHLAPLPHGSLCEAPLTPLHPRTEFGLSTGCGRRQCCATRPLPASQLRLPEKLQAAAQYRSTLSSSLGLRVSICSSEAAQFAPTPDGYKAVYLSFALHITYCPGVDFCYTTFVLAKFEEQLSFVFEYSL